MSYTLEQIGAVLDRQLALEIQQGAEDRDSKLISGIFEDIMAALKAEQGGN
jgi:hypothetical protein